MFLAPTSRFFSVEITQKRAPPPYQDGWGGAHAFGHAENAPYMRREISVYTEIYFCIYEKRFPYMRKFLPVRTEMNE